MTGSEVLAHGLLARGYLAGVAVRESVAIRRPCNPVYCDKYSAGPYSKGRNYWMGVGGAEYTHSPAAPTLLYTRDHESCTSAEASSVVRWEGCAGMKNLGSTYHPPIRTAKSAGTENMTRQGWSNVWAWPWSHGLTVSPHAAGSNQNLVDHPRRVPAHLRFQCLMSTDPRHHIACSRLHVESCGLAGLGRRRHPIWGQLVSLLDRMCLLPAHCRERTRRRLLWL